MKFNSKKFIPFIGILSFCWFISCQDKKDESIESIEIEEAPELVVVEEKTDEGIFSEFESQPAMKNWLSYHQSKESPLNLSKFNLQEPQKLKIIPGNVKGNFEADFDKTYEPFLIYNPSKTMYLDIDSYNWEVGKDGFPMYNSDSEINLVNLMDKTVNRVAYYGPSYWVEDAFWVTDSIFALLENNDENQPSILIVNLKQNKISSYTYEDSLRNPTADRSYIKKRLSDKGIKVSP